MQVVPQHDHEFARLQPIVRGFLKRADRTTFAVLYYAGHGVTHDGDVHLLPADAGRRGGGIAVSDLAN